MSRKEITRAGPAPGRVSSPAAAVPTVAKMPAPTIPPIPSITKSTEPRTRFKGLSEAGISEVMPFVRSRLGSPAARFSASEAIAEKRLFLRNESRGIVRISTGSGFGPPGGIQGNRGQF